MKKLVFMLAAIAASAVAFLPGANAQVGDPSDQVQPQGVTCTVWYAGNAPCPVTSAGAVKTWANEPQPWHTTSWTARRISVGWRVYGGQTNNGVQTCLGPEAQVVMRLMRTDGTILWSQGSPFHSCGEYYNVPQTGEYTYVQFRFYRADCGVTICGSRYITSWSNYN